MANTKVTKAVLADDAVGLAQLDITNDPSDGQALTAVAVSDGYNLTWADNTVAGISSSADATAITITSAENVGIGTTSPNGYSNVTTLTINGSTQGRIDLEYGGTHGASLLALSGETQVKAVGSSQVMTFEVNNAERARIASDGAFGIANSNPHFDLDTNEARLGYYSAKGLGYNFFTTSINFSSGTSTKYIAISYGTGLFYNLDLDLHGQYGNFNAEGGIRKVYTGGVNASDSNIYGNGNAQLFSLGNTATYYSTGAAAKSGTAKIRIPITGTSLPAADTLHVGIRMFGIHLDRITSIAIE